MASLGEEGPPPKRMRRAYAFVVTISSPQSLKTVCNVLNSMLTEVTFQVSCVEGEGVLQVDSMDLSTTCCLKVRFPCDVDLPHGTTSASFRVAMQTFFNVISNLTNSSCITLSKLDGADKLQVKSVNKVDMREYTCPTMDCEEESANLVGISTPITAHWPVSKLKAFVKTAKTLKCDAIYFQVEEMRGSKRARYISIGMRGDSGSVDGRHTYQAPFPDESKEVSQLPTGFGPVLVNKMENVELMDASKYEERKHRLRSVYDQEFQCEYVHRLLKGLEKGTVTLGLAQDAPLILTYDLGLSMNSTIVAILAANVEDSDSE